MSGFRDTMSAIARLAGEVVAETLWPTRCALCDQPGSVLCGTCADALPFLDWWRACPHCGSPYGLVQCDWCNPVALARFERDGLPFAGCSSAMMFDDSTGRLVRVYKDQGERRLAAVIASYMARTVPPGWDYDAVTFTPATKGACRRRGFDHMESIAREMASLLGTELVFALGRPASLDQRGLGGSGRVANLKGGFTAFEDVASGRRFLLVDDVMTTGSTICAAADALLGAGAEQVFCLTFARVL